ncbi:ribonuclease H-like domain-containing protein [Tanacetum coccineum]
MVSWILVIGCGLLLINLLALLTKRIKRIDPDHVTRISKLDISNPLHLHHNDTTASTVVLIKLKGTENYQVWSCAMLLALKGKNKIGFIDGICRRSNTDERQNYTSAPDAFFVKMENSPILINVISLWKVGKGANQHMTYTVKELDNVLDISHLRIKVGHPNGTEAYIFKIGNLRLSNDLTLYDVMVIPEYCVTLISVHKLAKENKVPDLVTRISKLDISDPLYLHPNDTTVLTVISIKLKGTENYQVWSCAMLLALEGKNKIGFIDGTCKRSSVLSREVLPDVRSAYATICSVESHRVVVGSIGDSSQRNQASAFVSNIPYRQNIQRNNQNNNNKELDNVLDLSHLRIKVGHPNGTEAYIYKIENLMLSNDLTLYDVMVIPEYCVTLISVHKLAKENKVIVAFDENRCYFLNQNLNLKIYWGLVIKHDWHCRLGHPAEPVLNVLKDSLQIDKKDNIGCYEICQRAKQTREHFPLSDHTSKSLGDLVHLDLWGPYKVTSFEGFKYFLTVVDDYTRAVWVYLIKSKDEVPYLFSII